MALLFKNNASATLATTLQLSATLLVVSGGQGALFPAPTGGDYFLLTIESDSGNFEVCRCTSRSADALTIVRAQEGTAAQVFIAGAVVECRVTAGVLEAFLQALVAATTYAPRTHFEPVGTAATLKNNAVTAVTTTAQGVSVRQTTGQVQTRVALQNAASTDRAALVVTNDGLVSIQNLVNSAVLRATGRNAGGSEVTLFTGDPAGRADLHHAGSRKVSTAATGASVLGSSTPAPYNSAVRLFNADGSVEIAAFGTFDTGTDVRLRSSRPGYPVRLDGTSGGGALKQLLFANPDGAAELYHDGVSRLRTTASGAAVTGVISADGNPTAGNHLVTRSWVETALDTNAQDGVAGNSGYLNHPSGVQQRWGQQYVGASSSLTIAFVQPFTTACDNIVVSELSTAITTQGGRVGVASLTKTNFILRNGAPTGRTFYWQAIGR